MKSMTITALSASLIIILTQQAQAQETHQRGRQIYSRQVRASTPAPGMVLPRDSLVRVRLQNGLTSRRSGSGDRFDFVVTEDVMSQGSIWIPRGTRGTGTVLSARKSGMFGKSGKLNISFGQINTLTNEPATLTLSKRAYSENQRREMAAGVSLGGALLLGPVGLLGGAFIHGDDIKIPAGSELYVATQGDLVAH
jgi:hypothetical protein